MKSILSTITFVLLSLSLSAHAVVMHATPTDAKTTYQDIQKTLGIVPSFMKVYPEEGISAAWEEFKNVQLNINTELSAKEKELIGLSVAAQIPCHYCAYFHTEAARQNGATEREIREAVAMAASARHWSTLISGTQYSEVDFKNETDKMIAFQKKGMENPAKTGEPAIQPITVTDPITAYQDIELTLGVVPNFLRQFPQDGIVGAWKMMKTLELNPNTALSAKEKELIELAVSAQVPCPNCVYFHTETSKLNGANTQEISETLAMASIVRFWSTVLNGNQIDESKFKREVGIMLKYVKSQSSKRVGFNTTTKN